MSAPADGLEPQAERTVEPPPRRDARHRIATSLAFTALFFAGAAFSAGAGGVLVETLEGECEAPAAEATGEAAEACEAETDDPAADEGEPGRNDTDTGTGTGATDEGAGTGPFEAGGAAGGETDEKPATDEPQPPAEDGEADDEAASDGEAASAGSTERDRESHAPDGESEGPKERDGEPAGEPILELDDQHGEEHEHELDPEATSSRTVATIWLHRTRRDPTPAARRLAPGFAKQLLAASERAGVEWAVVLAAVRADSHLSRWPARGAELRETAKQLRSVLRSSGEWEAFLALTGRTAFADRATALTHYNRAVGLRTLVTGLDAAKPKLERKVLADSRLDIYGGGRTDIRSGRIDVRVLVLLRYLAERYGQVTVSSLDTGHGLYARPGVVSAHKYGLAVDIALLGGRSILGNSAPGGTTEQAVRDILLLPSELRPKQVISLLALGGPSFAMGDHADHIHVGY